MERWNARGCHTQTRPSERFLFSNTSTTHLADPSSSHILGQHGWRSCLPALSMPGWACGRSRLCFTNGGRGQVKPAAASAARSPIAMNRPRHRRLESTTNSAHQQATTMVAFVGVKGRACVHLDGFLKGTTEDVRAGRSSRNALHEPKRADQRYFPQALQASLDADDEAVWE
jgi:hypothetical protein